MDSELQDIADKAVRYAINSGVQYCDARAEQQERRSALLENNDVEHIKTNNDKGIGIRLIKKGTWGFCSITNPNSFEKIKDMIDDAIKNAEHNTKDSNELYPNYSNKIKIDFPVLRKPNLEEMIKIGTECNKIILDTSKIIKSVVNP